MRLDQPGADEPPGGVIAFAIRRKRAADRGDPAILDSDIEEAVIEPIDETGISDNQNPSTALISREALASLDDLVGAGERRFGGISSTSVFAVLRLMTEFELCRLLDRQIAGFGALEDLVDHAGRPIVQIGVARAIAQQPADIDKFPRRVGG